MQRSSVRSASLFAGLALFASTALPANAYVRSGMTQQVDLTSSGDQAEDGDPMISAISEDGRYVAFDTTASLVPLDLNQMSDVYLRDMKTGNTELISADAIGFAGVGPPALTTTRPARGVVEAALSQDPSISANGRFITYSSTATNLVIGDTNGVADIFLFDRRNQEMQRLSVSGGEQSNDASDAPSISADGGFVSFSSFADNLVSDDTNAAPDVFVRDVKERETVRASIGSSGEQTNNGCVVPSVDALQGLLCGAADAPLSSISADGRFVAFDSEATNLVPNDTNAGVDVFLHDLKKRTTGRVSVATDGSQAEPWWAYRAAGQPVRSALTQLPESATANMISSDGRYVAFYSNALNLVPSPNGGHPQVPAVSAGAINQVYVRDMRAQRTTKASVDSYGAPVSDSQLTYMPSFSSDGRYVVWQGCMQGCGAAAEYVPGLLRQDLRTGSMEAISRDSDGSYMSGDPSFVSISATGRFLTFTSGSNITEERHLYWRDLGSELGGYGASSSTSIGKAAPNGICFTSTRCIKSSSAVEFLDRHADVSALWRAQGADLYGATLAHRPHLDDLFIRIQLEEMPSWTSGLLPTGAPAILYGFRFIDAGEHYEVRVQAQPAGRGPTDPAVFGLFHCAERSSSGCTELGALRGSYGTTGHEIVVSLPLSQLPGGGRSLSGAEVYSGLGTYGMGAERDIDSVRFR